MVSNMQIAFRHGVRVIGYGRRGLYEGSVFTKGIVVSAERSRSRYSPAFVFEGG